MSKNERALNLLKSLVDTDVYIELLVMLAGKTIYFPETGTQKDKQERNQLIRKDYQDGRTYKELCELYGLSDSQIRRITKYGAN